MMQIVANKKNRRFHQASINAQRGVSLIEILISMFVLAIGILGVVSLQAVSIKDGVKSQFSTRAQMLTEDVINRVMANTAAVAAGSPYVFNDNNADTARGGVNCLGEVCTAQELAQFDVDELIQRMGVDLRLPDGSMTTTYTEATREYTVALTWNSAGDDEDNYVASVCNQANNLNPGCLYTVVRL